ncbi:MAG TPA: hypothetical protein VF735_00700 [Pyrinomonadaceae bacterium]|jgi:hypothetical protein
MSDSPIRDIPHIKKTLDDAKNIKRVKKILRLAGPALRLFKVDVSQIKEALADVENLEHLAEELAAVPDRFNDLFAERGWIIYDLMNLEVAKAAIKKAEDGAIDGAEEDLVNYYNAETVEWLLRTMHVVKAFRPRMSLAEKALADYREERYHACVPVVLALLDGLVNELHEKRRGFFADEVDLQAWDSIAAHDKGLNVLVEIFRRGRYKTTTEPITIPYRNGIIHGMDLGYDNKVVAAKAWAALFATRDWAIRAEQRLLVAPPEKPERTWGNIAKQLRENQEDKARLEAWKARTVRLGVDAPRMGDPDAFTENTPEQKLAEFFSLWKAGNYGHMAQCITVMFKIPISRLAGQVREIYALKPLRRFEFLEIKDEAAAITNIEAKLWYEDEGIPVERTVVVRLMNEDSKGDPVVRGKPEGVWRVVSWGLV